MTHSTDSAATANIVADTICRTVELGLSIDDAADGGDITHLFCHPRHIDDTCPRCHEHGQLRDHVDRRLTDLPIAGHPTLLHVKQPRMVCGNDDCDVSIFRASMPHTANDRESVTWRVSRWILQRMAVDNMSVKSLRSSAGHRLGHGQRPGLVGLP